MKNPDEWYNVAASELIDFGGKAALTTTGSVAAFVAKAFPERSWLPWRFTRAIPKVFAFSFPVDSSLIPLVHLRDFGQ